MFACFYELQVEVTITLDLLECGVALHPRELTVILQQAEQHPRQRQEPPTSSRMTQGSEPNGGANDCWDSDIYDYRKLVIKDSAAIEVDLRGGWWIRCMCCRGRKFRMRNPFDIGNWIEHKQSRSHMSGAIKLGICDNQEKPLLKRRSAVRSLRVRLKDMHNGEYAFCGKSSQAEVRKQAREDQVTLVKVISSLSCLVSEQQDDIQELRARLREMHHGMLQMTSAFEDVQDSQHKLSQNVCSYLDEVTSQPSPHRSFGGRRYRARTYDLKSQKSFEGYDTEDTDKSLTDMSIFEDQAEFTEME